MCAKTLGQSGGPNKVALIGGYIYKIYINIYHILI